MDETRKGPLTAFLARDLDQILAILERLRFEQAGPALAALEAAGSRLRRHIDWEEGVVFPAGRRGEPGMAPELARLEGEHAAVLDLLRAAQAALAAGEPERAVKKAVALCAALRAHGSKEEKTVFPGIEARLGAVSAGDLLARLL